MAAAAEQLRQQPAFEPELEAEYSPLVLVVPEMAEDKFYRHQANRFIGSIALEDQVVVENGIETDDPETTQSMMEAIHQAARGNEAARKLIEINARTDVIERTIKAVHVMEVPLEVNEQGKILQFGQTLEAVHANTLRFASENLQMRARTEAETRNAFRIEQLHRQGWLKDYNFVVFSRAADDMTRAEMKAAGFFVETMSCAIQVTYESESKSESENEHGLKMESAFVAGIKDQASERHDGEAIVGLGDHFGINYRNMSTTEIIDTPVLIHKSLMPNGVVDLVAVFDSGVDGESFFGEAKQARSYVEFKEACKLREVGFEPKVANIVNQLVSEYHTIRTPLMATDRLHEISQEQMVDYAIGDNTIDARAFGPAALHIEQARLCMAQGNAEASQESRVMAKATAASSSCPTGRKTAENGDEDSDSSGASADKIKKMTCPFCGDKSQYGKACSPNQHCSACDARVVAGKVTSKGNGGKKAKEHVEKPEPNKSV